MIRYALACDAGHIVPDVFNDDLVPAVTRAVINA